MGIEWKNKVKKILAQGALAGVLLLFAGLPQAKETEKELPRTVPGVESQAEREKPDGEGHEEEIMPLVDLEEEEKVYN